MTINPGPQPDTAHPWGDAVTPYVELGGQERLRVLVDHFYCHVRADSPKLRAMHPADDSNSRRNLFEYLSGWMGGPNLYTERKGHPKLRMRHMPFSIGREEAAEWMSCMRAALSDTGVAEPLLGFLETRFADLADHMRNSDTG